MRSCSRQSAEAMTTLASNPRRLGAQIVAVAVLHTWGTLTHHPHVPCVVASGGLSRDGTRLANSRLVALNAEHVAFA